MGADFTPSLDGYTGQGAFRFWCQKVLPLVYDDSLSYYELLCKVVDYLNKVIQDVGTAETNIGSLLEAYNLLQGYVNDYFTNLDVQEEIDNKLDAMLHDGSLEEAIQPAVNAAVSQQISSAVAGQLDEEVALQLPGVVSEQIDEAVVAPAVSATEDWLDENISTPGESFVLDASLTQVNAAAQAKATGDAIAPCIKYKTATATSYSNSLANLENYTCSIVNGADWLDAPVNDVGLITTIHIPSSTYGFQIWQSNAPVASGTFSGMYVRRRSSGAYTGWFSLIDASLSVAGVAAEAKAVGDAISIINNTTIPPCIKYKTVAPESFNNLLANLENYTCSIVNGADWLDAPVNDVGLITTIHIPSSTYGFQIWQSNAPVASGTFSGMYVRRRSSGAYTGWFSLIDASLSVAGVAAEAKAVGDAIAPPFKASGVYYAFGDSLVKAQIGRWSGATNYSTKGYADATAKLLHLTLNNQAVGGQGLIKDWATIIDNINSLDMSDASLITVGWMGNDGATWRLPTCALGAYTDTTDVDVTDPAAVKSLVTYTDGSPVSVSTTVIGFYYTIMKLLQTKCPSAQIVLVTAYGAAGGDREGHIKATLKDQFTGVNIYGTGGNHTVKERYDALENMCNLHGWCCVNQAKGCTFNEFNADLFFGDHVHPTDAGYAKYGNNLCRRIAAFYANKEI